MLLRFGEPQENTRDMPEERIYMNIKEIRSQFPLINNKKVIYLDNAATTQKPQCVIDAISEFYTEYNANPMRGIYDLSIAATDVYENAREKTASFINAHYPSEAVFTKNATESLNLAADILSSRFSAEDEILVATSEHHSNFLPWKKLGQRCGAKVKYLDCDSDGNYSPGKLKNALTNKTKLFAIAYVSNVIGKINPIKEFARICHENNTYICVDATQSVAHMKTDVTDDDVDFLAFSAHKMYGPMGVGVLYAKKELLEKLPPFLEGGEMIDYVSKDKTIYAELPHKYEAGTVSAADVYAFGKAIDYINEIGFDEISKRERELTEYLLEGMKKVKNVQIIGAKDLTDRNCIVTFTVDDVHPHDVASVFAESGICIRAGHHCAQPLHILLGIPSTVRASVAFYNTKEEIDIFLKVLSEIRGRMGY